jgi:hypothetical protein
MFTLPAEKHEAAECKLANEKAKCTRFVIVIMYTVYTRLMEFMLSSSFVIKKRDVTLAIKFFFSFCNVHI